MSDKNDTPEPAAAPPVPPPAPRQLSAHAAQRDLRPTHGALVNPGDLCARLGDGSACPAGHWPRTGDAAHDRRAFAAAFLGVSGTHRDPDRPAPGTPPAAPVRVLSGGAWAYPARGGVTKDQPVGPAVAGGHLVGLEVEACPADEAVGKAVEDLGNGVWRVELRS